MEPLTRITYRDPDTGQPRTQSTLRAESLVDYENYLAPSGRAHGSALHSPGVATGLEVHATQGSPNLRVLPGLALSADGSQIVLAAQGSAIYRGARAAVTENGVLLQTAGAEGPQVLTIRWGQLPDDRVFDGQSRKVVDETPELILRPGTVFDSRADVVLATVTFAAGVVTALGIGARRQCGGDLTLTRPTPVGSGSDLSAGSEVTVHLRPADSGLEIAAERVGIGTASPRARLDVAGAIALNGLPAVSGVNGQLRLNEANQFPGGVQTPGTLSVGSANIGGAGSGADPGTGNLAVAGDLGIGTATPRAKLDVAGAIAVNGLQAVSGSGGLLRLNESSQFAKGVQTPGALTAGSASIGAGGDPGAGNLAVGGSVGIGTASPRAKLDVAGAIAVNGLQALSTANGQLRLNESNQFTAGVQTPGALAAGSANIGGAGNGADPGPTNLAVGGSVGIGTAIPRARLDVAGAIALGGLQALSSAGGQLRLNESNQFTRGVQTSGTFAAGSANIGGVGNGADPGAGNVVVGGNTGLGTAAPQSRLHVQGDALVTGALTVQSAFRLTGALAVSTINPTGPLAVTGGLRVTGGVVDAGQGLHVTGDSSVTGTLSVDRLAATTGGPVTAVGGLSTDGTVNAQMILGGVGVFAGDVNLVNLTAATVSAQGSAPTSESLTTAVQGTCLDESTGAVGVIGIGTGSGATGIRGVANTGENAYGVWGVSAEGYAGVFDGKVRVAGMLEKNGGGFRIDHPLDPENRFLNHSFVESPDMLNVYCGIVETDGEGAATVQLPEYFTALNAEFTYQLTVLGELAGATVVDEVGDDNVFTIRSEGPNQRVSWLVTGIRQDSFARENRIVVDVMKSASERSGKTPRR